MLSLVLRSASPVNEVLKTGAGTAGSFFSSPWEKREKRPRRDIRETRQMFFNNLLEALRINGAAETLSKRKIKKDEESFSREERSSLSCDETQQLDCDATARDEEGG